MSQKLFSFLRTTILYKILKVETRGVRVAIFNNNHAGDNQINNSQILLVRHRYNGLWVFPGGGIKKGEIGHVAAARECREEVGIEIIDPLIKFGEYINNKNGKNDSVTLFVCRHWSDSDYKSKPLDFLEISDKKWFSLADLPDRISKSTRQRLIEIQNSNMPISKIW